MADEPLLSTPEMVAAAGITYRQIDYWSRTERLRPRIGHEPGRGQGGVYRQWDTAEVRVARLMGRLTAAGINPTTAEQAARAPQSRYEIGPGIWIHIEEEVPVG